MQMTISLLFRVKISWRLYERLSVYVSFVMDFTRKFVNVCNVFESANAVLKQIEYTAQAFNKSRKEIRIFVWFRL